MVAAVHPPNGGNAPGIAPTEVLIQGYNSSLTMLGGGNQNTSSTQDNKQNFEEGSQVSQNDLDDDIPF